MSPVIAFPLPQVHLERDEFVFASLQGLVSELSGPAALSATVLTLREAQRAGDTVAWLPRADSIFYPPDAEASGVDLSAITVVRVPQGEVPRAGELLVRLGGFGLIVIELCAGQRVPTPLLSRLLGLAQKHEAAVLFLTQSERDAPSIDPLVGMRAWASAERVGEGRFVLSIRALKDKRRAPGWERREVCRGPAGLR